MRVVVVVAVRLYREGLAHALAERPSIDVVGTAADGPAAVAMVRTIRPTVVLVDAALVPEMVRSSLPVTSDANVASMTRLVALGVQDDAPHVLACVELGVAGYVHRDATIDELVQVLRDAERGEVRCSARLTGSLVRRIAELASAVPVTGSSGVALTERELEVVALVEKGLMNKEIARRLGLSLSTVKNHVHNVLEKLQLDGRAELARWHRLRTTVRSG